jgi:hypothetical protein
VPLCSFEKPGIAVGIRECHSATIRVSGSYAICHSRLLRLDPLRIRTPKGLEFESNSGRIRKCFRTSDSPIPFFDVRDVREELANFLWRSTNHDARLQTHETSHGRSGPWYGLSRKYRIYYSKGRMAIGCLENSLKSLVVGRQTGS